MEGVTDERLTRRVGTIAFVVLGLAIVFAVFIAPRIDWREHVRIRVYFHDSAGLREGAPFVVAGKTIGHVESIAMSPEGIVVTVAVERAMARRVMRGGDIFIAAQGALGARYLEIGPSPTETPALADGDEFRGRDPVSIDRIVQRLWIGLTIERAFAETLRPELAALSSRLAELDATLGRFEHPAFSLHDLQLPNGGELRALAVQARATLAQARGLIALSSKIDPLDPRVTSRFPAGLASAECAIGRVSRMVDQVEPVLAKLDDLQARMGEGTVGRLATDLELDDDIKGVVKQLTRHPWTLLPTQKPGVSSGPDE